MWLVKLLAVFVAAVFLAPTLAAAGWWALQNKPASWAKADWSATGLLPSPSADREAAVYVLAARTGGFKGAFSVHSWIVLKKPNAARYERYDKVGWGEPVRRNAYPPDGRWYSNMPSVIAKVTGPRAEPLVAQAEAAIARYPWSKRGDYTIWPGPNSNSFTAFVVRQVPGLHASLPPTAIGRDFSPGIASFEWLPGAWGFHATLHGIAGIALGLKSGIELQFLGLVAGVDFSRPALLIPAFGRLDLTG